MQVEVETKISFWNSKRQPLSNNEIYNRISVHAILKKVPGPSDLEVLKVAGPTEIAQSMTQHVKI